MSSMLPITQLPEYKTLQNNPDGRTFHPEKTDTYGKKDLPNLDLFERIII
jgi:hypothetical protein